MSIEQAIENGVRGGRNFMSRIFYRNIFYAVVVLHGALLLASLNAPKEDGSEDVRYQNCALVGADALTPCPALTDDTENQNQQIFNISVALTAVNGLLLLWSILNHWGFGAEEHTEMFRFVIAATNIGLLSGIVGWFNMDNEALLADANVENSVYFKDTFNPFAVAVAGVSIVTVEAVVFQLLNVLLFKGRCDKSKQTV
jgi:hypothetical protein